MKGEQKITAKEIINVMSESFFEVFGLRADDGIKYNVGDICNNSRQLFQDDPEDGSVYDPEVGMWDAGELPGTCAVMVTVDNAEEAFKMLERQYPGKYISLIAGNNFSYGFDDGEVIIENAEVVLTGEK